MINREQILQHIKDEQLKLILIRVLDKAEGVLKRHEVKTTDFLTPAQAKHAKQILAGIDDISFIVAGGYADAERVLIVIYPDYLEASSLEPAVAALEIVGNSQFHNITHRDYLGAILGLGLKREKIGDIILQKQVNEKQLICQVIVSTEIKEYILYNLDKIGSMSVGVSEIPMEEIKPLQINFKEMVGNVASLRIDAVVAMVCRISRGDAQALINRQHVNVNWEVVDRTSYEISQKDVISIRGKGRYYIDNIKGLTRSGRITIQVKIPL